MHWVLCQAPEMRRWNLLPFVMGPLAGWLGVPVVDDRRRLSCRSGRSSRVDGKGIWGLERLGAGGLSLGNNPCI